MNIIGIIKDIISGLFTSDSQLLTREQLLNSLQQVDLKQIELNTVSAQSNNFYHSGWRPAAGWMAVIGIGYNYILYPIFHEMLMGFGFKLIAIETPELWTLLFGLLGLGTLRTYEKVKLKQ